MAEKVTFVGIVYGPRDAAHPGPGHTRMLGFKRGFAGHADARAWFNKLGANDFGCFPEPEFDKFIERNGYKYGYSPELEVE